MTDFSKLADDLKEAVTDAPPERIPGLMTELASMQTLLAARLLSTPVADEAEADECLTLAELAERVKMGESTIRGMVTSGQLREGEHYARKGRKLLFFWSPIRAWLRQTPPAPARTTTVMPFVRRRRRHG